MSIDKSKYKAYIDILKEELLPATGCTEPIAIAYAAAKAHEVLGCFPEKLVVRCSGNIIKNAKSVTVPNTGNLKGIKAAALAGAVGGDASREMQVLEAIKPLHIEKVKELMSTDLCDVQIIENDANLHIIVQATYEEHEAIVEIIHTHTNISKIEKDGKVIFEKEWGRDDFNAPLSDRSVLNVKDIYEFANSVDVEDVQELLDRQIEYNLNIAKEGLNSNYGANIGKVLLKFYGDDVFTKIKAYTSAGSDARMSGCSMPVVTNSGSGNQGMTTSLPIIVYAQEKGIEKEKMYRALVLANLISIHQKTGIGRLSAYCGAVSAACGSGTGITYLEAGTLDQIEKTITNTLANISGIVCDGAKASCAAKIASSLDAAIMAHFMAMSNIAFDADSGIVKETVEDTISAIGRLGRDGMRETDIEVLKIMLDK